jgi:hypothetical protein
MSEEWASWECMPGEDDSAASKAAEYRQNAERQRAVWYKTRNKLVSVFEGPIGGGDQFFRNRKEILSIFQDEYSMPKIRPDTPVGSLQYNADTDRMMKWDGSVWVECIPPRPQAKGPPFAGYDTWVDPNTFIRYVKLAPGEVVPFPEELVVGHGTILMGNDNEKWSPDSKLKTASPQPSSGCKTYEFSSPPLDFSKK